MFICWQKGGVYHLRLIGFDSIIVESDDWRYFSAELKLRLDNDATLSQVYVNTIKEKDQSNYDLFKNRRGE